MLFRRDKELAPGCTNPWGQNSQTLHPRLSLGQPLGGTDLCPPSFCAWDRVLVLLAFGNMSI